MRLGLSEDARNGMVQIISALIDSGGRAGHIELVSEANVVLSTLLFSYPSAGNAKSGNLSFKPIREDGEARASGTAVTGRIRDSQGILVFECDVGDEKSDAVIRLNSNKIVAGGPVRIKEFILKMPG